MKISNGNFLTRNASFWMPLKRQNPVYFNILSGLRHRTDPIYHILKSPLGPLGDP